MGLNYTQRGITHLEGILDKCVVDGDCIVQTGYLHHGYGVGRNEQGERHQSHRLIWEAFVGPIPEGLVLDHLCRRTNCVNPAHLEPVTQAENMLRSRKTHCKHGHPYDAANTYVKPKSGCRQCRKCHSNEVAAAKARRKEAA